MILLKDAILRLFVNKNKRKFKDNRELLEAINKQLSHLHEKTLIPLHSSIYDAEVISVDAGQRYKYAIAFVQKFRRESAKSEVGHILQQMEKAEKKGEIAGGVVIYITNNIKEWAPKDCLTITSGDNYNGKKISLLKQYISDWDYPRGYKNTRRRYAIFFTKGAESLDN